MLNRLRRRGQDESGVVLVVVAIMMVAILGMAALAIDVGSFYQAQRQAQAAADAGALAASQDLPGSGASALTDGTTYATTNYPGATATVSTPYNGSSSQVKVTVNATTPSFFGRIFGITKANVSASAVAGANGSSAPAAIFAHDSTCGGTGVALNGNSENIGGAIVSNGSLSQSANPSSTFGPATYGGPSGCSYVNNGSGTFASGPTPTTTLAPYPIDFRNNPPACTFSGSSFTWSKTNSTLPSGVYCATGTITLSGNNMSGTDVTFIGASIVLSGNNSSFSAPSSTNLLFWQTGSSVFDITSNHVTTGGTIFAPSAPIVFDGNNSGSGFIEGEDVTINGNSFQITGTGPVFGGGGGDALLQ
jgi:Flp pilus assembly protein TadG